MQPYGGGGTSFARALPPHQNVPAGHVSFRILCHASRIGGVIGKSGSIIKQLQHETSSRIRVDESPAPPNSGDRVIIITASSSITRKVFFSDEEIEVSAAQEAVVRVFEKILDVAAESNGGEMEALGLVSCRLLAEQSHAGSVIGKGGKVVEKIRKDTGSKIRVLTSEKMPACACANDEMIEIEGDFIAVKKALIAVSRRLQDSPPVGRAHEVDPQEILADGRMNVPPVRSSVPQVFGSSFNHTPGRPFSSDADQHLNTNLTMPQQEVTFRILCSNERVGVIIGRQGTNVRALQNESGASINVASPVPDCKERLITITATENAESRCSPAQNAVVLVFNKSTEAGGYAKGIDFGGKRSHFAAQVVVSPNQVGCLLGKGGAIIAEMRRATGAYIRIIGGDEVPRCASENDQVVQITGDLVSVQEALYHVTGRLRDNQFSNKVQNGAGMRKSGHELTALTRRMGNLGVSYNLDGSPQTGTELNSRNELDNGKELNSVNGVELGSDNRAVVVTNTTIEIAVPESVMDSVYGENGSNLTRLKQISGAKVIVHEPRPGTSDRIVVISGNPNETQAAQSLLQAFILSGSS
ncbi:hypothetical protein ACET3Z_022166 [Daucus carota]